LYGFGNKYRYRIEKVRFRSGNIPTAFKGLKIVQISDIHSGSLDDLQAVKKGIEKINDLQPDVIFFTGDLVNNMAKEMEDKIAIFSSLKAPLGIYSILGNHDYGDYVPWPNAEAKKDNLDSLKNIHAQMGWRLLLNEHIALEKRGCFHWSNWNRKLGCTCKLCQVRRSQESLSGCRSYTHSKYC